MTPVASFALAFATAFAAIVYIAAPNLFLEVGTWGDMAADMLHANALSRGDWLTTGHYSRHGFNHPGPAFFYWNALFEALPVDRAHAWIWGSVTLNALLVAGAATGLAWLLVPGGSAAVAVAVALFAAAHLDRDLGVAWMPTRLEAPFLLLLVSLAWLAGREARALVPAALACGMLVHGYVTMAVIVPALLAVTLVLARGSRAPWPSRRALLVHGGAALGVGALFLLPLAVEASRLPGGNFGAILEALGRSGSAPEAGWSGVSAAMGASLGGKVAILVPVLLLIVLLLAAAPPRPPVAVRVAHLACLSLAAFAIVVVAHWGTPAPMEGHSVHYLRTLGIVAAAVATAALRDALHRRLANGAVAGARPGAVAGTAAPAMGALAMGAALAVATALPQNLPSRVFDPQVYRNYPVRPVVDRLADAVERAGPRRAAPGPVAIDKAEHMYWEVSAGLLVELDARGIAACTTWRDMAYLYTEAYVCPEGSAADFRIVPEATCDGACRARGEGMGLVVVAR
ncbi:hypothetical protein DLJ49_07015 [Rhodovulum sp. 12E13]|uniref:hypothetical protein n=1 Tax=Rhodovulum sp. 12E13 TaxID=2203891 RepID=UPI000E13A919|nr:hypothetical protein [Rhodovulum sp. 12E13]RDC73315.1 hypothetical protein DLJ49_07015 [Rhodovulum sp. 12E13]